MDIGEERVSRRNLFFCILKEERRSKGVEGMDESGKGGKKRSRKNGEKKMNGEERTATSTINDDNQANDRANIEHSV